MQPIRPSRIATGLLLATCFAASSAQARADEPDLKTIGLIVDESLNRSEVARTAAYLTDRIGGRITNSPSMRAAEKWTQSRFRDWGLANVRAEGFEFGRGWSQQKLEVRMVEPRVLDLHAIAVAWTPGTDGTLIAPLIVAPMKRERDFLQYTGKLRGKIVLISRPGSGSEPDQPAFSRLREEDIAKLDTYPLPSFSQSEVKKDIELSLFESKLDAIPGRRGRACARPAVANRRRIATRGRLWV